METIEENQRAAYVGDTRKHNQLPEHFRSHASLRAIEHYLSCRTGVFLRMSQTASRGRLGSATIGVLTITEREFDNGCRIFGAAHRVAKTGYQTDAESETSDYPFIICRSSGRTNVPAGGAVGGLMEDWRPAYILLCGTAGGILEDGVGRDDTILGDVIVADFVDYTEFQKLHNRKALPRKIAHDHPSIYLREHIVEPLRRKTDWHRWIGVDRPDLAENPTAVPTVVFGSVAAGEKVLSDLTSAYQKALIKQYDKALVFETESFGVAWEVLKFRKDTDYNPQFLTIRSISDFINDESANTDRKDWTPYAASCALAFARFIAEDLVGSWAQEASPTPPSARS